MVEYAKTGDKVTPAKLPDAFVRSMKAQPKYRWWKPIVAALLAAVFFVAFQLAVALVLAAIQAATDFDLFMLNLRNNTVLGFGSDSGYLGINYTDPIALAFVLLGVAVMLPAAGLASMIMGLGGFRGLSSVEGKLRMGHIKTLAPWVFGFFAVAIGLDAVISIAIDPVSGLGKLTFVPSALLVIIVLTPLQAAAEEYVFRGFLLQAFGSWIPAVAVGIVLQAALFAAGHSYDLLGVISIFILGLCLGFLTVKTGGLEAGILMHAANNTLAILLASLFASQATQSDTSVFSFVFELVLNLSATAIIYQVAKRNGLLLADEQPKEEPAAYEPAVAPEVEAPAYGTNYCFNCGTALKEGAKFCFSCGTQVREGGDQQ